MTEKTPREVKLRRLTKKEWAEAAALWELGEIEIEELVQRYGLARETFYRKFKAMGIEKASKVKEHAQRVQEVIQEQSLEEVSVWAARRAQTKEDHYKWAETIAKMTMQELVQAIRDKAPVSVKHDNIKTLEKAANVLAKVQEMRYKLTGLEDGDGDVDDLPELVIHEMTNEQIKETMVTSLGDLDLDLGDLEEGSEEDDLDG